MAKKITATRSRLAAIVDRSSMGLSINTEIEVSPYTFHALKYCLYKAHKSGISAYKNVAIADVSGAYRDFKIPDLTKRGKREQLFKDSPNIRSEASKSKATYLLTFYNRDGSSNSILYNLEHHGKGYFLNITGNPSSLVYGANDIPILIVGSSYDKSSKNHMPDEEKFNSATVTFKYMNRIMYAILDWLLEEYGFQWVGEDKQNLDDGNISIASYQLAWYSSDLGDARNDYMRYLKVTYAGNDNTSMSSDSIGYALGLNVTAFARNSINKENNNINISAMSGANKAFSLTLYAKDAEPNYIGDEVRLSSLIRWDCTLNNAFLSNNGIRTIKQLEERYIKECEKGGYDIGFVRFIQSKLSKRIKLGYVVGLTADKFKSGIRYLEDATNKYEKLIATMWLAGKKIPDSFNEVQAIFAPENINKSKFYAAKESILQAGIDVSIPRTFYSAVLDNRLSATRTMEEREAEVLRQRNRIVSLDEKHEREKVRNEKFLTILNSTSGVMGIRKFTPKKIRPADMWILNIDVELETTAGTDAKVTA